MKAEDYLRTMEEENERFIELKMLNIGDGYKAVDIARKEEREKAINAFKLVLEYAVKRTNEGVHIELNVLMEQFKKLLNK